MTASPDTCALCGEDSNPILTIQDGSRVYLSACALCLIRAFDQLTGYKMEKLYRQYERMKQVHAAHKAQGRAGVTRALKGQSYDEILAESTAR